jgi:hypothetical protein
MDCFAGPSFQDGSGFGCAQTKLAARIEADRIDVAMTVSAIAARLIVRRFPSIMTTLLLRP